MEDIKVKDRIEDLQTREVYLVIKEPNEQGYVEIKNESLINTNISETHTIHQSEIDNVYLKKL